MDWVQRRDPSFSVLGRLDRRYVPWGTSRAPIFLVKKVMFRMRRHRARQVCALLALVCLSYSQSSYATLACEKTDPTATDMEISYSDTAEYSRFEFNPVKSDTYWIGVVFEFFGTAPTSPLLEGISPSAQGQALSEKFTQSFKAHLGEQVPYDSISDTRLHRLDGRYVTTFDTVIGNSRHVWAVFGQWDSSNFQFFRSVVPIVNSYLESESVALDAMQQMFRNCLYDEA